MTDPRHSPSADTPSPARRVFGVILGLVLGLLGGLLVALFWVGPGEYFFPAWGGVALGAAVLGGLFPSPFVFVGELVLGMFTEL